MRAYDHQEHLDLADQVSTLERRYAEISDKLHQLAADDAIRTDDALWKKYQIGQTTHLQIQRELGELRPRLRDLEASAPRKPVKRSSHVPAMARFMLEGLGALEEAERELLLTEGVSEGRFKNAIDLAAYGDLLEDERMPTEPVFRVPGPTAARVASDIDTGTGAGGGALPTTGIAGVANAVKYYGGVANMGRQFEELGYLDAIEPNADDTGVTGVIGKQQTDTDEEDTEYDGVQFKAVRSNSKYIDYSQEMLSASPFNLVVDLTEKVTARLGRAWDNAFTNGDQTEGVEGIIETAKKGFTVSGATAALNLKFNGFPDLVNWLHSVPVGYREEASAQMATMMADGDTTMLAGAGRTGFILADGLLLELRLLKDGDDRPLWLPSVSGMGPGTILGYPFSIAGSWPVLAKNKPMGVFGNFRAFGIRNAGTGAPIIRRFDDSGPGTNFAIRIVGFMHRDAKVRIPKSVRADGQAVANNKPADATDAYAALWAANN
ncbi:MAG: phage major capsid protein [Gemmatimonadetes bacterium]|nr:phage major capsid protein [Gemmatimonadota bacterium]MYD13958.1 phage major capsid protein [Gemmatimonadota bacterium]MYI65983.1 phage major capsid protein [Gemmatimonadota bacterium]